MNGMDGGTCLKPSFEPIIMARKPFKGSCIDNVIEWGVGGINIDECRVGTETTITKVNGKVGNNGIYGKYDKSFERENPIGRFPANTILTYDETDFDEVCGGFPINKSTLGPAYYKGNYTKNGWKNTSKQNTSEVIYNDSGSAARYFYCAKASKRDRDEGLEEFEEKQIRVLNATNPELENKDDVSKRFITIKKNIHPTVKPTELMQYLVRLVTPKNGIILDPFNGSGSTGKAVMYENKDRNKNYKYIGIELSEEYLEISKARINFAFEQIEEKKEEEDNQLSLWKTK